MESRVSEEEVSKWARANGKCIVDICFYERMQAESLELSKLKMTYPPNRIQHHEWGVLVHYECSVCGRVILCKDNYCRDCGAKLR